MSELMLKSVYDLLNKNYFIPSYQRGYRWEKRQIQDLLEDLYNFACDKDKTDGSFYCLQPIVVKKCDEVTKVSNNLQSELDNNEWYEVIDGQQRLTSLYLLLKYLIDTDRCDLYTDYGKHLFRLSYQTRCTDTNYISDPSTPSNSSPNAYYITEGYKNISEWFTAVPETKNIPQVKKVRNRFMELLTNTKDEYNENGYVQVIWYETSDPDPIKTFTRLNIGKIPLKNAELIKALFLQKRDDSEVSNIQQIQIAKEWDQIEATLQNKRIWAFLNKDLPDMPAHIEFIFDVIFSVDGDIEKDQLGKDEYLKIHGAQPNENVKKQRIEKTKLGERKFADKYGTDEYASFRFFSARFENVDRSIIESEWDKVREYYETFAEWYNNPLWYHYIGFLIYCGEPITSIYKLYKDKTKVEFAENLISAIKCKLKVKLKVSRDDESKDIEFNGDPIIYASKTKDKLKYLLVLYNIEYIIQKNKDVGNGYILFPFDLFKSEKWDIEHVDSFTTNPLTEIEQQKEWLITALDDLKEYGIVYSEKEKITEAEAAKIDSFLEDQDSTVTFNEIKLIVSKLAGEYLPSEEVKKDVKNTIGNLTLLNADINRGYGNSIFPSKKKQITKKDAEGRFIPICTKNVFLKNFIGVNNTSISWSETDMKQYRKNIVDVLDKFLIKEG